MIDFRKRTMSSFGLSIGTGLMLESLFAPTTLRYDVNRVIPNVINHRDYKYHFINVITLVRNIIQSFEVKLDPLIILKDKGLTSALFEEISIIYGLYSTCPINLVFYYNDVKKLAERYNKNKDRKETQPLILNKAIQDYLNKINLKAALPKNYNLLPNIITLPHLPRTDNMLLTTNIPVDLCSPNTISLLDTHTGILYGRDMFYKKFNQLGNKDMSNIPFREKLLYVVGDKNLSLISNTVFRALVVELSISSKWNYLTTQSKIDYDLSKCKDLSDFIRHFKGVY